jgi:hypothetical protein
VNGILILAFKFLSKWLVHLSTFVVSFGGFFAFSGGVASELQISFCCFFLFFFILLLYPLVYT